MPLEPTASLEHAVNLLAEAISHRQAEAYDAALGALGEALTLMPLFLPARLARAELLSELLREEEALTDLDHAIAWSAPNPALRALRAATLEAALNRHTAALQETPAAAAPRLARVRLLIADQRHAAALSECALALREHPELPAPGHLRTRAQLALGLLTEALADCHQHLARHPEDAIGWYNLGHVLQRLGRLANALPAFARAQQINPDLAEAYVAEAHCRLARGDFTLGWARYEWRWQSEDLRQQHLKSPAPRWPGPDAEATGTLLLWAEQGFGDTLQFARFAPLTLAYARHVVLRVPPALVALISRLDPRLEVIADTAPLPAHDQQCPLLSLPHALRLGRPPASGAYLAPDAQRCARWREHLAALPAAPLRIGLCWAGHQFGPRNSARDLSLEQLLPLTGEPGLSLISLQKEIPAEDEELLAATPALIRFDELLENFDATAALIAELDGVISVDTAVAHLAGALGKPCWLLLPRPAEWRWGTCGAHTPWYPHTRVLRQPTTGDWASVLSELQRQLRATLANPLPLPEAAPLSE